MKVWLIILLSVASFSLLVGVWQNSLTPEQNEYTKTDYISQLKLGLSPNSNYRFPNKNDIDTGVRLKSSSGGVYALVESRTFETKDYGKTFLVRVE